MTFRPLRTPEDERAELARFDEQMHARMALEREVLALAAAQRWPRLVVSMPSYDLRTPGDRRAWQQDAGCWGVHTLEAVRRVLLGRQGGR